MFSNKRKPAAAVLLAILVFGAVLGTDVLLYKAPAAQGTPDGTVEGKKGKDDQAAQAKSIKPSKNLITGVVDGKEEEKLSPPNGFITKKEDFDQLWKVWLLDDKAPEVDFETRLVVVATSRKGPIKAAVLVDEKETGDMKIKVELERQTEGTGLQVLIAVFARAGIKTIEGKAIGDK